MLGQDTVVVEDLSLKWMKIESDGSINQNLDEGREDNSGFFIFNDGRAQLLKICGKQEIYIWVDGRLYSQAPSPCEAMELQDLFAFAGKDTLFVSVSAFDQGNFEATLMAVESPLMLTQENLKRAQDRSTHNFVIIFMLLMILHFVMLRSNAILLLTRLRNYFRASVYNEAASSTSFFSQEGVVALVTAGILVAFDVTYLSIFGVEIIPSAFTSFWGVSLAWFNVFLVFVALVVLKYLGLYLFSTLFSFSNLRNIQHLAYLDFLVMISGFLSILFLTQYWLDFYPSRVISDGWRYYFPIFVLVFGLILFVKLTGFGLSKKLHIISYLCTTELIPAYYVAYLFLK